jgi:hypothetical protein
MTLGNLDGSLPELLSTTLGRQNCIYDLLNRQVYSTAKALPTQGFLAMVASRMGAVA